MATSATDEDLTNTTRPVIINADWLCGANQSFWDASTFWNQEKPEFSECFVRFVWSVPPSLLLWIIFPFVLVRSFRTHLKGDGSVPINKLNLVKSGLVVLLFILALMDLIVATQREEVLVAAYIDAGCRIVTFKLLLCLIQAQRKAGLRTSGSQFTFWSFFSFLSILPLYFIILNQSQLSVLASTSTIMSVVLIWISLALNFFVEPRAEYAQPSSTPTDDHPCPEINASFPSKLAFSWFTPLAWSGFKRDLTTPDLWNLVPYLKSRINSIRFEGNLQLPRTKKENDVSFNNANGTLDVQVKHVPCWNGVMGPLVRTFGMAFLTGSILKLIHDILIFVSPYVLKLIIKFANSDEPMWVGIYYSILLFATSTVQTLLLSKYFYKMYLIGMQMRATLINAVYKKSLKSTISSKDEATTGEKVNLISVDIQRMVDLMPYLNMMWSAPLQIVFSVVFLWRELGPSVLAGLLVMVLLIPVNGAIAAKARQYQIRQMKKKDERVKIMNEILQGIKILKLYAWEGSFEAMVNAIRGKEIQILTHMGYLQAGTSFIWSCAPFVVSLVSFATFVLVDENNVLDSEKAFVSLSLFNILRFPLSMLPMMISMVVQSSVSIKRLNKFMSSQEIKSDIHHDRVSKDHDFSIEASDASFSWDEDQKKPTLHDINLKVKRGSLVAIVGSVGAGKSSLLSAFLGDMSRNSGSVTLRGNMAFVPQQAWVQNATVKDNIIFGKEFKKQLYDSIIKSCALTDDLKVLQSGDETEIGEKGINLSGGQKQRISLARAIYSKSDLYLLDDPLSAVDSHVGKHIFDNVIGPAGCLRGTTRILVTHGMTFLPQVDQIVVIKDGSISETGHYSELLEKKGEFAEILVQFLSEEGEENDEVQDLKTSLEQTMGKAELERSISRHRAESECQKEETDSKSSSKHSSHADLSNATQSRENSPRKRVNRAASVDSTKSGNSAKRKDSVAQPTQAQKQYLEEKAETGRVSGQVYWYYLVNMGIGIVLSCVFCYTGYQICSAWSSIWLSQWADDKNSSSTEKRDMYLGVYGGLGVGQAVFAVVGSVCLYFSCLKGAEKLHHLVLRNMLHSPMKFFDTTPQGRILNRFSKDIDVLDSVMPMILRGWITCLLAVISTFLIISYTTPLFLAPTAVVLVCYYIVQRIYVASSRQLKRLESISRSPIYSHFGETINGVQTIRAYNLQEKFILESEKRVDENTVALYPSQVANRWLAVRLETVGNVIIFCSALFAVLGRDGISPGLVGLSLSYALSVTQTLNWLVRMTSEVETNIVAVERLKEYAETEQEAAWYRDDVPKEKQFFPTKGQIEFRQYSTRYREGLNLALNKVSFSINGGERVGIVGRTGAGKSSLTMALFRIVEPVEGQILIDGQDIKELGLQELRSQLSIIPQEPVLFSGSLRMNLDPFDEHSDEDVIRSLKLAHLGDFLESLDEGLSHKITEGGSNLSVGQRQLVCLARALLRKAKILVLDEATAAVDMETDEIIQKTIRQEFTDTTILTIAHRLKTILDYNKIVVLANGSVTEEDSPDNLLKNKSSAFYKMCAEAGLA